MLLATSPGPVSLTRLAVAATAALAAGMVNSVAGGGTLLTFPSLIAAGLSPLTANATSTVALLPASLSAMLGYRSELGGARRWATLFAVPSLVGGGLGAVLLLHTSDATFSAVVPWLVLGATTLFLVQRPLLRRLLPAGAVAEGDDAIVARAPGVALLIAQLAVGVYGGYFGAGIGILMLAALGFMGFTNIHRMNGLKNWGGFCMNLVAALIFATSGLVDWGVAVAMALGSVAGGYTGARLAQRVRPELVRGLVGAVGLVSGIWLMMRR